MIKVLHKAFDLLESMSANKERVFTLAQLAGMIEEKPTTCANIVKTLCARGYLSRVGRGGYTLGPVAMGLNYEEQADTRLVEIAREPMLALVQKYGASGVLAVLRHGKKKILDDYKSDSALMINKTVRADHELYTTSTGLCLTSRDGKKFSREKEGVIRETYGSPERLIELREKILTDGYIAISLRPQVFEVAATVVRGDTVVASVAVYLPTVLIGEEEQRELTKELRAIAKSMEERITI